MRNFLLIFTISALVHSSAATSHCRNAFTNSPNYHQDPTFIGETSTFFRIYDGFFTCVGTITHLDMTLTGGSTATSLVISQWRKNGNLWELLQTQEQVTASGITSQTITLLPMWVVAPGDALGIALRNAQVLNANVPVVRNQEAPPDPDANAFVPTSYLQGAVGDWPAVLAAIGGQVGLPGSSLIANKPGLPLISPRTSGIVPPTPPPGVTTPTTTRVTTKVVTLDICPHLTTMGGFTRNGALEKLPGSVAQAVCRNGNTRTYVCLIVGSAANWVSVEGEMASILQGNAFHYCSRGTNFGFRRF